MVSTEVLLSQLAAINDVKKFLEEHQQEFIKISPAEYLKSLAGKYKLSIAEIARNAKLGDFVHKMSGGSRMKNIRNTTLEERIQIAEECIAKV